MAAQYPGMPASLRDLARTRPELFDDLLWRPQDAAPVRCQDVVLPNWEAAKHTRYYRAVSRPPSAQPVAPPAPKPLVEMLRNSRPQITRFVPKATAPANAD
jgi:hypothetical protein